jgi:hypothetical protein
MRAGSTFFVSLGALLGGGGKSFDWMNPQNKIIKKVNIIAMIALFSISLLPWIPF